MAQNLERSRPPLRASGALFLLALAACSAGDSRPQYSATPPDTVGDPRPAAVYRPSDYDPSIAYPLVVMLHGYGANGWLQDVFFGATSRVDSWQFLLAIPEGTVNESGKQYWNAGPCCVFDASAPDDVAYLSSLVDTIATTHHVDPDRVYVLGHSNGGFMALELACRASERFAAVASLAGAARPTEAECPTAVRDVSVLAMHGDADAVVLYEGSATAQDPLLSGYPSADETARRYAARLGCDTTMAAIGAPFDFVSNLDGDETTPLRYETGCAPGTSVELWTIAGGSHLPYVKTVGTDQILDWLFAHHR